MKFGCITAAYDSLSSHLTAANISPFVNNWNNVHDFTPVPGESNFSILKKNSRMEEYIHLPEETVRNQLKVSFTQLDSVIPCTLGTAFRPDQETCLIVLFVEDSSPEASQNLDKRAKNVLMTFKNSSFNLTLVQTKKFKFSETSAENVFGTRDFNDYLQCGPIIGLEYSGADSNQVCAKLMQSLQMNPFYITEKSGSLQQKLDNFYNFADMQMSV